MFRSYFSQFKESYSQTLILAFPIIIAQIGHMAVQFADSVIVGQFVGTNALAAVALVNSVFILFMIAGIGLSTGLTPLIARAHGAGQNKQCATLFANSLTVNTVAAIILFTAVNYGAFYALPRLGQPAAVLPYAIPYLRLMGYSIVPLLLFQTLKQFTEGLGYTRQAMNITIWGNVLNVILGIITVKGLGPVKGMGIIGVGIATLIDRVLMCIAMGTYILKSKTFRPYMQYFTLSSINKTTCVQLLKMGVPIALQLSFEVSAFAGATILAGNIGATQQAAHQVALNLASITFMGASGIASATTIKVGNHLGVKGFMSISKTAIAGYHMVQGFMAATTLVFILFRHLLPQMYSSSPQVISAAASLLLIAALFQFFDGAQVVGLGILRGLGDVVVPTAVSFLSYWVLGLPVSWYLGVHLGWGVSGIWYGLTLGLLSAAILLYFRYRHNLNKLHGTRNAAA